MNIHHTPVMAQEVVMALQVVSGDLYIDCTIGEGGHSLAILGAVKPPPHLLGLDLDAGALSVARQRLKSFGKNVILAHSNYSGMKEIAEEHAFPQVNGVLLDLGISSLQVDEGYRGFSFRQDAPLDMRFDTTQTLTAHQIVNEHSEESLADIFWRFGEERRSRRIASAIVRNRPIKTTSELANIVSRALGRGGRSKIHPATRTFQAIRMAVNGELDNIEQGLEQAIEVLGTGGRLAVISYHSLEDRLVKNTLRREASDCICPPEVLECTCGHKARIKLVRRRVIKPSKEEIAANPRSRSARMRVAERI